MALAMASGVEAHWPRQTVFPSLSMTHRWVVCCDTSRPTYCSIAWSPCMVLEGKLAPPRVPRYGAGLWNRCFYEGTTCSAITPCVLRLNPPARPARGRYWPDYQQALRGAPLKG